MVAQLGDLPYLDLLRNEPRNEVLTPICTMSIFNVAVVVGGDHPPRIESSTKEQKGLNNIYRWNHNDDWSMTELFNFLEMFNSSPKS